MPLKIIGAHVADTCLQVFPELAPTADCGQGQGARRLKSLRSRAGSIQSLPSMRLRASSRTSFAAATQVSDCQSVRFVKRKHPCLCGRSLRQLPA